MTDVPMDITSSVGALQPLEEIMDGIDIYRWDA
jgi:hypothetical protein